MGELGFETFKVDNTSDQRDANKVRKAETFNLAFWTGIGRCGERLVIATTLPSDKEASDSGAADIDAVSGCVIKDATPMGNRPIGWVEGANGDEFANRRCIVVLPTLSRKVSP